jgi:uncharacterized membrane protein HdeD (DUF308 family)
MFRNIEFYDRLTGFFVRPWWIYLLMGIDFILLAILIVIFPALAAYLIAGFLLLNGVLLVSLGFKYRNLKNRYKKWKDSYWIEVE